MLEVEMKIRINDPLQTKSAIMALGAKYRYNMEHTDVYYNCLPNTRDFARTDEALRLRKTILFDPISQKQISEMHDLTYKGPKLDKIIKTRVEHVARVLDPEKIDSILTALGFQKIITIPKHRKVFELEFEGKATEVLIDKVEELPGDYLEVEMQIENKSEMDSTKQKILHFIKKIGYTEKDSIRISYLELVLEQKRAK